MATEEWKDPDVLEELYHDEGLSTHEIADKYDENQGKVYYYFDKYDVETRSNPRSRSVRYYTKENGCCYWQHIVGDTCHSVQIHRLTAVAEYGFDAVKDNVVHHKNGLKWDNRPENLEPMTSEEHGRLHRLEQLEGKYD